MHASRLFLFDTSPTGREHAKDCMAAATSVLEMVDEMARESSLFYSFWWTHYVTFCALVVTYAQLLRDGSNDELAERCYGHLALATRVNSPSRGYAIILEELRDTVMQGGSVGQTDGNLVSVWGNGTGVEGLDSLFALDTWQLMNWPALEESITNLTWPN